MKINTLRSEVKNAKEAARAIRPTPSFYGPEDFPPEGSRMRATSTALVKHRLSRQHQTPQHASTRYIWHPMEMTSPLIWHTPASPPMGSPVRPSAASIRSMNHNRRHSSIDYHQGMPPPATPTAAKPPLSVNAPSPQEDAVFRSRLDHGLSTETCTRASASFVMTPRPLLEHEWHRLRLSRGRPRRLFRSLPRLLLRGRDRQPKESQSPADT
jgi:hypothetical protein